MTSTRLEAFSDGVIAIIITIMVLELKTPHDTNWTAFASLLPVLFSYILSFIIVGIYWGNHHHLLHTVSHVNSKIIWANLHLLFWLSLIPFATAWMGENNFNYIPVAVYAALLTVCGLAYYILLQVILDSHKNNKDLLVILKKQSRKGMLSFIAYALAIPAAFVHSAISAAIFILVAIFWIIPDSNIEKSSEENANTNNITK